MPALTVKPEEIERIVDMPDGLLLGTVAIRQMVRTES
jgi:hypothetical protein